MQGFGSVIGKKAPDFSLKDQNGKTITLNGLLKDGPIILAFYPGDFTPVCTKQLCNYRDSLSDFEKLGLRIVGISSNDTSSHVKFSETYKFTFSLLSDPKMSVARDYGCTSLLMFGSVSRAVVIINKQGLILYRYIEPTTLTRRKADELIQVLEDLKKNALI